jgi:hypothetical protein
MPTVNVPRYFDVVCAIESAILEASRESGTGISQTPTRCISTERKTMGIWFTKLGNKDWKSEIWVEKVGGETKSSAYRITIKTTGTDVISETVHLTGMEQLADLALRYAEMNYP